MKRTLGIAGVMLMVLPAAAGERLKLVVTPARAFAPATVIVRVTIEPDASNRALAIVADGEDFYRSSEIYLEGERAPRMFEVRFPNVPGGEYDIAAVLIDNSGRRRAVSRQQMMVMYANAQ